MTTTQILGFVATGLVIVGYIPQIVHLIKERCTAGISISAFSLWCTASLLFLIHAAMIGDAVFVGAQTVNLVAGGLIVAGSGSVSGNGVPLRSRDDVFRLRHAARSRAQHRNRSRVAFSGSSSVAEERSTLRMKSRHSRLPGLGGVARHRQTEQTVTSIACSLGASWLLRAEGTELT